MTWTNAGLSLRGALAAGLLVVAVGPAWCDQLYRNVDEKGNVTFADRPLKAGQASEQQEKRVSVASPEARRQMEMELDDALVRARRDAAERRRREYAARHEAAREQARADRSRGTVIRLDPNLPDSPPPDTTRRYYYK